jgi:hypothetical protein
MVAWIIMLLMMFEGYADISAEDIKSLEKARQTYQSVLSQQALQQAVVEEKNNVITQWETVVSSGPKTHYLVTGPNCPPCIARKRYMDNNNIPYTPLTLEEARGAPFNQTINFIPYEFDFEQPLSSTSVKVSEAPSAQCVVKIIEQHLLSQAKDYTTSSILEFDIDTPDILPSIINSVMVKQKWSNDLLSVDWSGNRTIAIQPEKITFSPPPSVAVKKGIFSFSTSLKEISVRNEGKQLEFEFVKSPNLTINFK